MKNKLTLLCSATFVSLLISGCATIIGGFASTAKTSGNGMGPATISEGDTTLQNDKFTSLSVYNGNLNIDHFLIANELHTTGNVSALKLTVKKTSSIGGFLQATDSSFYDSCKVSNNVIVNDSYFGTNIEFGGTNMELTNRSKVVGNIISTNPKPVTIIIDRSLVKGDIGFANSNSTVIIQNKGHVKGKVLNGKVQDLTGSDNYEGDDDMAESTVAIGKPE